MILAPQLMANEKDPKKAAAHCFNSIELDPENYRIGHTKASNIHKCGLSQIYVDIFLILNRNGSSRSPKRLKDCAQYFIVPRLECVVVTYRI